MSEETDRTSGKISTEDKYRQALKDVRKKTNAILAAGFMVGVSIITKSLLLINRQNEALDNRPGNVRFYEEAVSARKRLENVMICTNDPVYNVALYESGLDIDKLKKQTSALDEQIAASEKGVIAFKDNDSRNRWVALGTFFGGFLSIVAGMLTARIYSDRKTNSVTSKYLAEKIQGFNS
jgi:hypothetical protein